VGIALAELGQRVLLIDADVRKPRLHSIFGISNARGLTAVLSESRRIADYSYRELGHETEVPDLFVLPCGPVTDHIFRLLNSGRTIELLQRLRNDYDTILVDTPPSLQFSHARIFGRLADATIIIVRAGRTDRASAIAVTRRFEEDNILVLGTVLNDFNPKSSDGCDYGYSSYYQKHDKAADTV
jgi:capsular exopolysaccharide synthesis family protein